MPTQFYPYLNRNVEFSDRVPPDVLHARMIEYADKEEEAKIASLKKEQADLNRGNPIGKAAEIVTSVIPDSWIKHFSREKLDEAGDPIETGYGQALKRGAIGTALAPFTVLNKASDVLQGLFTDVFSGKADWGPPTGAAPGIDATGYPHARTEEELQQRRADGINQNVGAAISGDKMPDFESLGGVAQGLTEVPGIMLDLAVGGKVSGLAKIQKLGGRAAGFLTKTKKAEETVRGVLTGGFGFGTVVGAESAAESGLETWGDLKEAAKAGGGAALIPVAGALGTKLGSAVGVRLVENGTINIASSTLLKGIEEVSSQLGVFTYMEVTNLPEYSKMTPEEFEKAFTKSLSVNIALAFTSLKHVTAKTEGGVSTLSHAQKNLFLKDIPEAFRNLTPEQSAAIQSEMLKGFGNLTPEAMDAHVASFNASAAAKELRAAHDAKANLAQIQLTLTPEERAHNDKVDADRAAQGLPVSDVRQAAAAADTALLQKSLNFQDAIFLEKSTAAKLKAQQESVAKQKEEAAKEEVKTPEQKASEAEDKVRDDSIAGLEKSLAVKALELGKLKDELDAANLAKATVEGEVSAAYNVSPGSVMFFPDPAKQKSTEATELQQEFNSLLNRSTEAHLNVQRLQVAHDLLNAEQVVLQKQLTDAAKQKEAKAEAEKKAEEAKSEVQRLREEADKGIRASLDSDRARLDELLGQRFGVKPPLAEGGAEGGVPPKPKSSGRGVVTIPERPESKLHVTYDIVESDRVKGRQRTVDSFNITNNFNSGLVGASNSPHDGAPIVTSDGRILAGNTRFDGVDRLHDPNPHSAGSEAAKGFDNSRATLADMLKQKGEELGVDVSKMQRPVLVRVADPMSPEAEADFSQAVKKHKPVKDGALTETGLLNALARNKSFFKDLAMDNNGVWTAEGNKNHLANLYKEITGKVLVGPPTETFIKQIQNAIMKATYGNNLPVKADFSIDSLKNALTRAAVVFHEDSVPRQQLRKYFSEAYLGAVRNTPPSNSGVSRLSRIMREVKNPKAFADSIMRLVDSVDTAHMAREKGGKSFSTDYITNKWVNQLAKHLKPVAAPAPVQGGSKPVAAPKGQAVKPVAAPKDLKALEVQLASLIKDRDVASAKLKSLHSEIKKKDGLAFRKTKGLNVKWDESIEGFRKDYFAAHDVLEKAETAVHKLNIEILNANSTRVESNPNWSAESESGKTAITRSGPSLPMQMLSKSGKLQGRVLDYGAGKGKDADFYGTDKYDPNQPDYNTLDRTEKWDTITSTYVLNTRTKESEAGILADIRSLLTEDGVAYISVRRDVKKDGNTSKGTFQRNVELNLPSLKKVQGAYETYIMTKHDVDASNNPTRVESNPNQLPESGTWIVQNPITTVGPSGTITVPNIERKQAIVAAHEVIAIADIRKYFEKALNVPIIRGVGDSTADGYFALKAETIRLRNMADLPSLGHEVGHYVHWTLFPETGLPVKDFSTRSGIQWFGDFGKAHDIELLNLSRRTSKPNFTLNQQRMEGYAEWMRLWLTEPGQALIQAPKFTSFMELSLQKINPKIYSVLKEGAEQISRYAKQSPEQKVFSMIARRGGDKQTIVEAGGKFSQRMRTNLFNDNKPIERAVDALIKLGMSEQEGQSLKNELESMSYVTTARVVYSLETAQVDLKGKVIGSSYMDIMKSLPKNKGGQPDQDGFTTYYAAKRAKEINDSGRESGISTENAQAVIDKYSDAFESTYKRMRQFQKNDLRLLVDGKVLSREAADRYDDENPSYATFARVGDLDQSGGLGGGRNNGVADNQSGIRPLVGTDMQIISPLISIIKNSNTFRTVAEHNNFAHRFLSNLSQYNGHGRIGERVEQKVETKSLQKEKIINMLVNDGDISLDQGRKMFKSMSDTELLIYQAVRTENYGDQTVRVFNEGRQEYYRLNDVDVYKAFVGHNKALLQETLRTPGVSILKKGASLLWTGTTMSPGFILMNSIRDNVQAAIYSKHNYIPFWDGAVGMYHILGKTKLYDEFRRSGGGGVSINLGNQPRSIEAWMDKHLPNNPEGRAWFNKNREFATVWDTYKKFASAVEQAPRMAEYRLNKNAGKSEQEASIAAANITLGFHRGGYVGKAGNAIHLFLNAKLQGIDQVTRLAEDARRTGDWGHVQSVVFKSMLYTALPAALAWYLGKDDDKIKNLPDWRKQSFFNFSIGGMIFSFPKPQMFGTFFGTGTEVALSKVFDEDPRSVMTWLKGVAGETLMTGDDIGGALNLITPTAITPLVGLATNRDLFRGKGIESESAEQMQAWSRSYPNTSRLGNQLGKAQEFLGIDSALSPITFDYLVTGYFGNLGRGVADAAGFAVAKTILGEGPSLPTMLPSEYVLLNKIMVNPLTPDKNYTEFYKGFNEITQMINTVKSFPVDRPLDVQQGKWWEKNGSKVSLYISSSDGGAGGINELSQFKTELSEISLTMKAVRDSSKLSSDEKRDALITLSGYRDKVAEGGVKLMKAVTEKLQSVNNKN